MKEFNELQTQWQEDDIFYKARAMGKKVA